MRIGKQRLAVVSLSFLVVIFALAGRLVEGEGQREKTYDGLATFTEVLHLVNSSYVDKVADHQLMVGAFRGMLANLDPHSGWLSPEEVKSLKKNDSERLSSGVQTTKRGGYAYVVAVLEDSPAARAKVEVGDYIRSINGVSTREMSVFQVRRALTGKQGVVLKLNLFGSGEGREAAMTLQPFQPDPLTVSTRSGGVLLIQMHYLGADTLQALHAVLSKPPEGTHQVLLDLRNTVGGSREDGIAVADLFLSAGVIVKVDERGRKEVTITATPEAVWHGSLAVLANGLSAGPVEIAIAALKGSERGPLLGERTFGDASIQRMIKLPDASAVILSVGRYLAPGGDSWSGAGVKPDVNIASREPADQAAPAQDDGQLIRALKFLAKGENALKPAA